MAKPSAFMRQMQANQERNMRLQRLFTIQQCEDMAIITLGQDFGMDMSRAVPAWPVGAAGRSCGRITARTACPLSSARSVELKLWWRPATQGKRRICRSAAFGRRSDVYP